MVSSKIPKEVSEPISFLGVKGALGRPLFAKLVPYSVHVAETIYVDRRDRLINATVVVRLNALTSELQQ